MFLQGQLAVHGLAILLGRNEAGISNWGKTFLHHTVEGGNRHKFPHFRFDNTQSSSLFQWVRKMSQPARRSNSWERGGHLTRASEHGLSGECRVGAEPSPKTILGQKKGMRWMGGPTDGRTRTAGPSWVLGVRVRTVH